ncbi:MAG: hypothetical protein RL757_1070 [Bacteroidota bacterium]|jgi:hypothetical protein
MKKRFNFALEKCNFLSSFGGIDDFLPPFGGVGGGFILGGGIFQLKNLFF